MQDLIEIAALFAGLVAGLAAGNAWLPESRIREGWALAPSAVGGWALWGAVHWLLA